MEFTAGMICPACESGKLTERQEDIDFEYKGKTVWVKNIKKFDCSVCGEFFINQEDRKVIEKLLTDERRKVDGLLTGSEIRAIRKRFGVTQVQFAKALRVGEKNFARYESGQSAQSSAMDGLLRILREHPSAFRLFKKDWSDPGDRKIMQIKASYKKKKPRRKVILKATNCTLNRDIA